MKFYSVTDSEFCKFGKVIDIDTEEIIKTAENIPMLDEGVKYTASVDEFEALDVMQKIQNEYFGGMPTQLGYCYGHNNMLNAVEWHKCSEINIAVTDIVLLLGDVRDIEENNTYNSEKLMAFKVKKGQAIEVYSTTLHYCPIETSKSGFGCVIGLFKGTNTQLDFEPDDKLIFAENKWLIAHKDNEKLINRGAVGGVYGINYEI